MKRRNINFRQTHSERSSERSYQNFGKFLKGKFQKEADEASAELALKRAERDKGGKNGKS